MPRHAATLPAALAKGAQRAPAPQRPAVELKRAVVAPEGRQVAASLRLAPEAKAVAEAAPAGRAGVGACGGSGRLMGRRERLLRRRTLGRHAPSLRCAR